MLLDGLDPMETAQPLRLRIRDCGTLDRGVAERVIRIEKSSLELKEAENMLFGAILSDFRCKY